ncbi:UDP-N-acetylglucosamine transporter UGNT1-like [Bidens hawaiensis]|uniref:UDP-N-acetylglucosamine transporter UGNT1-like n=1 Tax=Bidens hawaiensis TaxID=980011 RepID=UPI00404AAC3E
MKASTEQRMALPVSEPPPPPPRPADQRFIKGSTMTSRGAYAAVSYMSCAVMLVLFNKAALSSYNFPSANVITLFQIICSCAFLYVLRRWRVISFTSGDADNSTRFVSLQTLVHTSPLALTYLLYMLATMESVRGVNVPMYTTLRRTTVVFTMIVEFILVGQRYSRSVIASVALIVFGAFVAGSRDLSFDAYGYSIVFLSNITTAVYLATISRIGKSSGLTSFGLMWCNGILCGPILLFWTFIRGDLRMTMNFQYLFAPGFMIVLLLSCMLAFLLNYSIFLNTTLNSAVTQTICGNLKDIFTIALGWMFFGGLPFDLLNVIGQILGFFGSGLYAYFKLFGK